MQRDYEIPLLRPAPYRVFASDVPQPFWKGTVTYLLSFNIDSISKRYFSIWLFWKYISPSQFYLWSSNWNSIGVVFSKYWNLSVHSSSISWSANICYHVTDTQTMFTTMFICVHTKIYPHATIVLSRLVQGQQWCSLTASIHSSMCMGATHTYTQGLKSLLIPWFELCVAQMHSKTKLPAFCRFCPRQIVKGCIKTDRMDLTNGVEFHLYPSFPSQSPSQVEQSTEKSNVIYAWSRPLKDAFP